jgi:hypothetical protein
MSSYWHIVDSRAPALFLSLASVLRLRGKVITQTRTRNLIKIEPPEGSGFYVKRFTRSGKGLRAYFGRSRARAEWENLQYFHCLGLNAPRLVSYGEIRQGFQYVAGAYVMREIPDVIPLSDAMTLPQSRDPIWRFRLLAMLGHDVARLHNEKFIHRDLYWRNILISLTDNLQLHFIDCPGGSYQWGPFFQYGRIRDLACLYKDLHRHFSKTELLRCFLAYVGRPHLNASDKKLLRGLMMRIQKTQI